MEDLARQENPHHEFVDKWYESSQRGDLGQALLVLEEGLGLVTSAHGKAFLHCMASITYARLDARRMAVSSCIKALRIDPDNLSACAQLGRLLLDFGKPTWASRCFQKELSIARSLELSLSCSVYPSARLTAYVDLARAQHALGKSDEAMNLLREALQIRPTDLMVKEAIKELSHELDPMSGQQDKSNFYFT